MTRTLACASSLTLVLGCSLQDFDPLTGEVSLGGVGGDAGAAGVGGDGGSGSNGGNGGSGNGGASGDGGTAGTEAGQGGAAGTGGDGGNGGSAGSPNPGELMADVSFENNFSSWAAFGTASLIRLEDEAEARTGDTSLLCTSREDYWNGAGFVVGPLVSSSPDVPYLLKAWIRSAGGIPDGGPPRELSLTLKTQCAGQTDTTAHYDIIGSAALTDEWTEMTGQTTAPRHCTSPADYRIYIAEPQTAVAPFANFYVDDVSFTRLE